MHREVSDGKIGEESDEVGGACGEWTRPSTKVGVTHVHQEEEP